MKDLIDILADTLDAEPTRKADVMRLVEYLYFENIRGSFIWKIIGRHFYPIAKSETFNIAQDIINLEKSINLKLTIKNVDLKSKTISEKFNNSAILKNIKALDKLTVSENLDHKDQLNKNLLKDYRYYVTAVMIAELIQDEKSKVAYRQVITWGIPIVVALIVSKSLVIGEIISKFFDWFGYGIK